MKRAALIIAGILLLTSSSPSAAQPRADDQARRLLEDARADLAAGRARQGLEALQTIVSGFSTSSYADDALLEIARYAEDVEKDTAKARDLYDQIAKKYPQSDSAPGAYLRMGQIALSGAASQAALDDALANFQRVTRLYPESPWVPHALVGASQVYRRAGRFDAAIDAARRAVLDHPGSDIAPEAQFELALAMAIAGDSMGAIEEFQRVISSHPASAAAGRALNATTALYRIHATGKPLFLKDPGYALAAGDVLKDVRSLAMTANGTLWVASDKTRSAVSFDPSLKLGSSLAAEDPQTLCVSPRGEVVFASKLAVKIGTSGVLSFATPSDKPGQPDAVDKIGAATVLVSGDILVSDLKRKRVLRFKGTTFISPFADRSEREVTKLLTTARGDVVMLRKDDKTIEILDESGRLLSKIGPRGPGFEWKKPVDVVVDMFLNLYVADEDQGIFVFSPKNELIATFGAADVRKPRAITIDLSGAPLVYDDRASLIVRFK